ncbi:MAG: hypothetical protein JW881_21760 [Spirochaetales bacterium]|nr:hypothetical protein [Spirochaetales bacterium]
MKKRLHILFSAGVVFFVLPFCFGNTNAIYFQYLPEFYSIKSSCSKLVEYEYMTISWTPEWKYDVDKEEVTAFLQRFYKTVCVLAEKYKSNMEILLLKALLEHYQYNLDIGDFFESVGETIQKAKALNGKDYRPGWILANHYFNANSPVEAWKEYRAVFLSRCYNDISPYFWDDYAKFSLMAMMPGNARMASSYAGELFGHTSDFEKTMGGQLENTFVTIGGDADLEDKDVWDFYRYIPEQWLFLQSKLLGISIEFDEEWEDLKLMGLKDSKSYFYVLLGPEKGLGDSEVHYSISILMFVASETIDLDFVLSRSFSKAKGYKKSDINVSLQGATILEAVSSDVYAEQGGARTIVVALKRERPQWPGIMIEKPRVIESDEGEEDTRYYVVNKQYIRLEEPIIYIILLDSCKSIYERSKTVFLDFIENKLVIE